MSDVEAANRLRSTGGERHSGGASTRTLRYTSFLNTLLKALCPVKEITPRYLYYFLSSQADLLLSKVSRGATVHRLATEDIRALEVPFPSVAEQRRIVAILDEAFDGIAKARANAERNLESIRTLAPGLIDAELASTSRETRALGELVEASCSLSYGIVQPGEEFEGGLPIVRPVDLGEKFIGLEGLKRVDPKRASGYQRTRLSGGDLLLCVRGDTGIVSIAGDELRDANVTRGIVPIRFDSSQVGQDFGYYLMRSSRVQSQIKQKTYGAALMQINIRDLRELRLPVVALPDQKRLVGRLNQELEDVQSLERAAETKLVALDDLKKSLLHHAFTGQL